MEFSGFTLKPSSGERVTVTLQPEVRAKKSSDLWSGKLLGLISTGGLHLQYTVVSSGGYSSLAGANLRDMFLILAN